MKTIDTHRILHRVLSTMSTIVIAGAIVSCDLTRKPTNSIPVDESLETYKDAVAYNRGVMSDLRGRINGVFVTTQEYQADCVNAASSFGNRSGDIHGWSEFSASNTTISTIYSWYYSTLKNVNRTIEEYPVIMEHLTHELEATTSSTTRKELEKQLKEMRTFTGNSYFVRAYYHFNLLLRFGTPYNAATASTDLGVPLVTTFDVFAQEMRRTVQEGYDLVFADLAQAEQYLADQKGHSGAIGITRDAITALKARIYLEMKQYPQAHATASELIAAGTYPLVPPTAEAFEQMWTYDQSTEDIMIMYLSLESSETPYTYGEYYSLNRTKKRHKPDFYPTQGIIDLYADHDLRKDAYFYLAPVAEPADGNTYRNALVLIQKFKGNPDLATVKDDPTYGRVPNGYHRPRVFRVAEQYLIAAEAAYFAGLDALTPLNALRRSRGLEPVQAEGEALLREIQEERTRELAFEGFRLWDLRRWGLPIKRMTPQAIDGVSTKNFLADPYFNLEVETTDPLYLKTVWPIPQHDINVYPEGVLVQNPGW